MDTAIPPPRILASEADDGPSGFDHGRGPAWPVRVGPVVRDDAPVPTQDRVGLHEEDRPAVTVEHSRERGEDRSVGGFATRTRDLAFEDRELVAQHEDLGVLGPVSAPTQHQ